MASEETVIADIERNPEEIVRARVTEFKGRHYVDFRTYYLADNDEWRPTKKGISLAVESFEELESAMGKVREYLMAQKLIGTEA